jgi:hypothetical protein
MFNPSVTFSSHLFQAGEAPEPKPTNTDREHYSRRLRPMETLLPRFVAVANRRLQVALTTQFAS